ncbi:hypothetical protein ACQ4PT_021349 [Festuca glaucescens]
MATPGGSPAAPSYLDALLSPPPAANLVGAVPSQNPRPRLNSVIFVPDGSSSGIDGADWLVVGRDGKPVRQGPPPRPPGRRDDGDNKFKELLLKKARGCCFKCLSPGHRISQCKNRARCLLCGESGHKARWCRGEQDLQATSTPREAPRSVSAPAPSAVRLPAPGDPSASGVDDMDAPGLRRKGFVSAAAPRTAAMADTEVELSSHAVVAVVVGHCPRLELAEVRYAFATRFKIPHDGVHVSLFGKGEYLVFFRDAAVRAEALEVAGALVLGRISFKLAPWTRFRNGAAAQLCYKARVCLEGIPRNAWHLEVVDKLFDKAMLVDSQDLTVVSPEESACMRLWVWMSNVDMLATRGVLQLEEPVVLQGPSPLHFPEPEIHAAPARKTGPLKLLEYPVLLHLDRVLDYTSPPTSSSGAHGSILSGTPLSDHCEWRYRWNLKTEDGSAAPRRPSAHSRLRFPDNGRGNGGAGGAAGGSGGGGGRHGKDSGGGRPPAASSSAAGDGGSAAGYRTKEVSSDPQPASPAQPLAGDRPGSLESVQRSRSADPEVETASLSSEDASLDDYLILASLVGKQSRGKGLGQGGRSAQPVPLTVVPESVVLELQDTPASSLFGGEDAVSALAVGPGSAGEASVSLLDQPGSPLGLGCFPVGVGPLDGPPSVPQSAGTAVGPILGLACSSSGGEGLELPVSDLCFLNSMFSATPSPLLQPPAHRSPAAPLPSPPSAPLAAPIRPAAFEPVRSSRLAAKPNSGMSTIEKARMVLLKKSGAILHDGPLGKEDLQKYRQIYAKPIPAPFVKAIEDLVEVNMPRKTAIPSQAPGLLVAVA